MIALLLITLFVISLANIRDEFLHVYIIHKLDITVSHKSLRFDLPWVERLEIKSTCFKPRLAST